MFTRSVLLFVLSMVLCGCGMTGTSVSYQSDNNQTVYESGSATVAQLDAAVGSGSRIVMYATAVCSGQNCTPEHAQLIFTTQGQTDMALSDRSISIVADGTKYAKEDVQNWNNRSDLSFSDDQTIAVRTSLSAIDQIANASSISARIGGTSLNFDTGVQEHLQEFLQTVRHPEETDESVEDR